MIPPDPNGNVFNHINRAIETKAPEPMNLRQCDDIGKEKVAQEILNLRQGNYTDGENDILRSIKRVGHIVEPTSPKLYLDYSCESDTHF
jgi:hypothetical protein